MVDLGVQLLLEGIKLRLPSLVVQEDVLVDLRKLLLLWNLVSLLLLLEASIWS